MTRESSGKNSKLAFDTDFSERQCHCVLRFCHMYVLVSGGDITHFVPDSSLSDEFGNDLAFRWSSRTTKMPKTWVAPVSAAH